MNNIYEKSLTGIPVVCYSIHTKSMRIKIGDKMTDNKQKKQTVDRILEVSMRLFLEKGYYNTSVQDILDELGDLTKGAIYHYFKSKDDIFDAAANKMGQQSKILFGEITSDNSLNGAEKLKKIVSMNISGENTKNIISAAPNLIDNPKFLAAQIKEIRDVVTPKFIAPIIELGVKDGSIKTDKPYDLAEAITIMINIWINPLILGTDSSRTAAKCSIINEFTSRYGFKLFDDKTIKNITALSKKKK